MVIILKAADYEKLSEYSELEGSELGEYCNSLLLMRDHHPSHGMSEEFNQALEKELLYQINNFDKHCRIDEKTEEPTEPRKYKELVWLDD